MSFDNPSVGASSERTQRNNLNPDSKGKLVLPKRKRVTISELPELPSEDRDLLDQGDKLKENGKTFSQLLEESSKGAKFQEGCDRGRRGRR